MRSSIVLAGFGAIISVLGLYLIPDKWGYACLGFGLGQMVSSLLLVVHHSVRARRYE